MNTSQIDSVILSAVGEHWTKVAMVIARVIDAMSHGLPPGNESYEVISRRIEALIHDGRLEAQGDTKNWRFSEVRLKPNTVRQAAMTDEPGAFLKLEGVGELIATRTLTLRQENGPTSEIMVLLGKPQHLPKHEDYYCPYQIKGTGDEKVKYTCGAILSRLCTLCSPHLLLSLRCPSLSYCVADRLLHAAFLPTP